MSRLTRDGTAEPVSRDQILRHARRLGNVHFPCSADHEQDWQPYPVDPYSAICDDHTYIHTYCDAGCLEIFWYACRTVCIYFLQISTTTVVPYCSTGYSRCCSASALSIRRESCSNLYFRTSSHQYCNVLQQVCVPAPARFERNERKYTTTGVLCGALRTFFSAFICPNKNLRRMLFHLTTRGGVQMQ